MSYRLPYGMLLFFLIGGHQRFREDNLPVCTLGMEAARIFEVLLTPALVHYTIPQKTTVYTCTTAVISYFSNIFY
jgi:hypothetical protein